MNNPGLGRTIERLKEDGKKVIVVSNNLEIRDEKLPVRRFIEENGRFPNESEKELLRKETFGYLKRDTWVVGINEQLKKISVKHGVKFLIKHEIFCNSQEERCLLFTPSNDIIHWDYANSTVNGANFLGGRIAELNWFP